MSTYTTTSAWSSWNSSYTVTTSTVTTSTAVVSEVQETHVESTSTAVWGNWCYGIDTTVTVDNSTWTYWVDVAPVKQSLEQRNQAEIERVRREEAYREEQKRKQQEMKEAEERALQLLKDNLTKKQLEAFEKDDCIPVDTAKGNKYLIHAKKGLSGNIVVLDKNGKRVCRLCGHPMPNQPIPIFDSLLAQKLFLELAEEEFLRIANRHPL